MDKKLYQLIEECRAGLTAAGNNPEHPWRLLTAANTDSDGHPQSRYVVLRNINLTAIPEIVFFTDQRSAKIKALQYSPVISLCFFDPASGLQLVIKAQSSVHNQDETSRHFWSSTPDHSLLCYQMKELPGTVLPAPFLLQASSVSKETAYEYFTVIKCSSISWDILKLNKEGNQRAGCTFDKDGSVKDANWLVP